MKPARMEKVKEPGKWGDLAPRVMSAIVMVLVGGAALWAGGPWFDELGVLIVGLMIWELVRMLRPGHPTMAWQVALVAALALEIALFVPGGYVPLLLGLFVIIAVGRTGAQPALVAGYGAGIWLAGYALVTLREDAGLIETLWLIGVVVATDIAGYFAGRLIGGPKFWPRVSPKKTWSGTVAGWIAAAALSWWMSAQYGLPTWVIGAAAVPLSLASQDGRCRRKRTETADEGQGQLEPDPRPWRRDGPVRWHDGRVAAGADLGDIVGRRRVSIFGATGSIGQSTIDLIGRAPDAFDVVALSGGGNIAQLAADAIRLGADLAVTAYEDMLDPLRQALAGSGVEAAAGETALQEAGERPADWVMSAIVGAAGLAPGMAALGQGATLALANKESLVTAGPLLMATARAHGATILPVDSEHSAVFQALVGEDIRAVERVIITASGGAFRDWPLGELENASVAEASSHPNWDMGQRITIDSASMFNKALELIETKEFFGIAPERIEVLVHPESLVHALVGFHDGALMAHLGVSDMRHAIGYALNWPERRNLPVERLDLVTVGQLNFHAPDPVRYPALRLAREVMARRGLAGAVFNAAKEEALDAFIDNRIRFPEMAGVVEATLERAEAEAGLLDTGMTLDNVAQADQIARQYAQGIIARLH